MYFLCCLMLSVSAFAQCFIKGSSTLKMQETETYTVEKDIAQCSDCHLWTTNGGDVSLIGNPKDASVKLKANGGGRTIISLVMLSPQGVVQCSKMVDVQQDLTAGLKSGDPNCDIVLTNFLEAKSSDGTVSFRTESASSNLTYEWISSYADGTTQNSTNPQPKFSNPEGNTITAIEVKVKSKYCIKSLKKTYSTDYWKSY